MAYQSTRTEYWQWQLRNLRLRGSFSQQFNAAFINLQSNISFHFFQLELPAVIFTDASFSFTMTAIVGLLQLKYQGKDSKTPFESHPVTTALAITCFLLYGSAYSIKHNHRYPACVRNAARSSMSFTGSLCLAATASLLFPDSVRPVIFVFYFMRLAAELLYWVYQRFGGQLRTSHQGRRRIQTIFTNIRRLETQCFTNRSPILPL